MKHLFSYLSLLFVICLNTVYTPLIAQNLQQNLQACYPLDGNPTNMAATGSPLNGTAFNINSPTSTTDRHGNANSALWFSGANNCVVELPDTPLLKPTTGISFTGWIKVDTKSPDVQYIVFAKNPCLSNFEAYGLALAHKTDSPAIGEYKLCCNKFSSPTPCSGPTGTIKHGYIPIYTGMWYHVGFYAGPDSMKLYINGVLDFAAAIPGPTLALTYDNTHVYLGGTNQSHFYKPFFGTMDNVRFYDRKLTDQEFNILYNTDPDCSSTGSGLLNGLQACYPLNCNAVNYAPVNIPGSLNGTPFNVQCDTGHTGALNTAYKFTGSASSYIELPNDPRLKPPTGLSVSAWAKMDALDTYQYIVFAKNVCTSYFEGYALVAEDAGNGLIRYLVEKTSSSCSSGGYAVLTSNLYNAYTWHHVVFYIDNGVIKLYVDGSLDQSPVTSNVIINYGNTNVYLGGTNEWYNYPLDGSIDNVRFYNRELTSSEVSDLYNYDLACEAVDAGDRNMLGGGMLFKKKPESAKTTSDNYPGPNATVKLFPNPVKDFVTIEIMSEKDQTYTISIYDISGKLVKTLDPGKTVNRKISTRWDTRELSKGTYFVKVVSSDKQETTHKLLIE